MKPREARILHVEDSEVARREVAKAAADIGANVVASAATFEEAREALKQIEELGVNVVLTDDTLSVRRPHEGRYVYDIARAEHPDIHILSVSGGEDMAQALRIPHISDKGTDANILMTAIEAL